MAKGIKTGGKVKGSKNKDPLQLEERAKKLGVDVFEIMTKFVAGDWEGLGYLNETYVMENASGATKIGYTITPEMRLTAGKELMKYIYSQKKAVELNSGPEGFRVVLEDYTSKK